MGHRGTVQGLLITLLVVGLPALDVSAQSAGTPVVLPKWKRRPPPSPPLTPPSAPPPPSPSPPPPPKRKKGPPPPPSPSPPAYPLEASIDYPPPPPPYEYIYEPSPPLPPHPPNEPFASIPQPLSPPAYGGVTAPNPPAYAAWNQPPSPPYEYLYEPPNSPPAPVDTPPAPPLGPSLSIPSNSATITIDVAQQRAVSPVMWGVLFEETEHAGEGGLYAELVRDRSFDALAMGGQGQYAKFYTSLHKSWVALPGTAWALGTDSPLNANNPVYLRCTVADGTVEGGMVNQGFNGIAITAGGQYYASLWVRLVFGAAPNLTVSLLSADGTLVYGQRFFHNLGSDWQKLSGMLTSNGTDPAAVLSVSFGGDSGPAVMDMDVVSLFPGDNYVPGQAYLNPFRADIVQALQALTPKFLRFPGGVYVNGNTNTAFMWKTALGGIETRPGHWIPRWQYWSTDGLGLFEYMLLCDALGAIPSWSVNSGVVAQAGRVAGDWVQDALDSIQFITGGPFSTYGAIRASMGRRAPWVLTQIAIGSADCATATFSTYRANYPLFFNAIRQRYPAINIISSCSNGLLSYNMYDKQAQIPLADVIFDSQTMFNPPSLRGASTVSVSEYSVINGDGDLKGALGEAAFMMGMERNSDVVTMASYAPLLGSVYDRSIAGTTALQFDNTRVVGNPSYYVQQMFAAAQGVLSLAAVTSLNDGTAPTFVSTSATCQDSACSVIIIKVVNFDMMPRQATIVLANAAPLQQWGQLLVLSSAQPYDTNTLGDPLRVVPESSQVVVGSPILLALPPYSLSFLTVTAQ